MAVSVSTDAHLVAKDFERASVAAGPAVAGAVKYWGVILHAAVRQGATGVNGGPHIITGRYHNSIRMEITQTPTSTTASVGTDEPYGLKLEQGGSVGGGFDDDPHFIDPHPHFGPAMESVESDFLSDLGVVLKKVLT